MIRDGLRESLKALDLNLLVTKDSYASPTVTSFIPHDKDELTYIKSTLKSRFNITIGWSRQTKRNHFENWSHGKSVTF